MLWVFGHVLGSTLSLLFWVFFFYKTRKHPLIQRAAIWLSVILTAYFFITDTMNMMKIAVITLSLAVVIGVILRGLREHYDNKLRREEE
jgi:hypothetical protein